MMNESNGIPDDCLTDSEVEWITVKLPVFTGDVTDRAPDYIDKIAFNIMSVDQRVGLNRVFEGYKRIYPAPATVNRRPMIARWVFDQIGKAFERSKDIPRQSSAARSEK